MSNTMIQQNGIQRYVDDFDLINTRPDVNKFTIASFKDDIANILKKHRQIEGGFKKRWHSK